MPDLAKCKCGCGDTPKPGRVYLHGHNRRVPLKQRFWQRVEKSDDCWIWAGHIGTNGYGRVTVAGVPALAHRVAYELLVGPIPPGLHIDHLCRNRRCVNPVHLEPVTPQENQRRGLMLITHCPSGHEYTAENSVVRRGRARRECRQCNREGALRRYHAKKGGAR